METVQVILFINPTKGILLNNYFKKVQETGVIKVMTDATNRGYKGHGVDGWINLGQDARTTDYYSRYYEVITIR